MDIPGTLAALGLGSERPVLVVVGGAGGMSAEDRARVEDLIRNRLLPVLERHGAAVVDGGTDAGVMRILGRARRELGIRLALLGVAAEGTVRVPGRDPGAHAADLEPGHSAVLLVPGDAWGDESPWIADVAGQLAGRRPSATLVINGGEITYADVEHSLAGSRPVLVLKGSGRTADAIACAGHGEVLAGAGGASPEPDRVTRIAASPIVTVVRLDTPDGVVAAVSTALASPAGTT